jgi:sigma-B regulation protein RsbU (phosphoserine phosphatase)
MSRSNVADETSSLAASSRERFEDLAARLGQRPPGRPALTDDYWQALRDLFTRDVTHQGLRELLQHEAQETFRFLTREVSVTDLAGEPFWKRHPKTLWRFFLAVAYRLSPWRRVLFAVAVMVMAAGWIGFAAHLVSRGPFSIEPMASPLTWLLLSTSVFFFLLALELRDKLGLKGDLEVARQIQFGLLPFEPITRDRFSIATAMRPANTVGGDYFDVVDLGDGRLAVAVGDVAGKGMPAALLMALLQGSLRTLLSAGLRGRELVTKLNAHLCANIPSNRLVTLFYSELDAATGVLEYVNCGHNPPFLLPGAGRPARLAATSMALGITTDTAFESMRVEIDPGERLLLYTDGVTEAENPKDEQYGEERLQGWLEASRDEPGARLLDGIIREVLHFCGPVRPRDDMTLMCVARAR